MKKSNLVSIIMPIYNTEFSFFDASVNSVLKQSHENFELILVDDGSTEDNSDHYKKVSLTDKRIKYIKTNNGGASAARNHGIAKAKGIFLVMIDSDDTINDTYIDELLSAADSTGADIVYPKIISEEESNTVQELPLTLESKSLQKDTTPFIEENWNFSFVGSLIKTTKANKAKFNTNLKFFEDIDYMLQLLRNSDYCRCSTALYCYKKRPTSATNSFTIDNIDTYINDSITGIRLAGKYFPSKTKQINSIIYTKMHNYAKKINNLNIDRKEKLNLLQKALDASKDIRRNSKIRNSLKNVIKKITVDINSPSVLLSLTKARSGE